MTFHERGNPKTMVLKLVGGTEPRKFYADIHRTLR